MPKTPGGIMCAARGCREYCRKSRLSFFRFPRAPERCRVWCVACGRKDLVGKDPLRLNRSYRLCSSHFERWAFMNPESPCSLVHYAYPTIFSHGGGTDGSDEIMAQPMDEPAAYTCDEPAAQPTDESAAQPTDEPAAQPKDEPAAQPKDEPAAQPKDEPAAQPKDEPAEQPTDEPAACLWYESAAQPTEEPAACPWYESAAQPTDECASQPVDEPVTQPKDEIRRKRVDVDGPCEALPTTADHQLPTDSLLAGTGMGGRSKCCIATCPNHSRVHQSDASEFFFFPSDQKLRVLWMVAILNPDVFKVCSRHFLDSDFVEPYGCRYEPSEPRHKVLKPGAFPSQKLPHTVTLMQTAPPVKGTKPSPVSPATTVTSNAQVTRSNEKAANTSHIRIIDESVCQLTPAAFRLVGKQECVPSKAKKVTLVQNEVRLCSTGAVSSEATGKVLQIAKCPAGNGTPNVPRASTRAGGADLKTAGPKARSVLKVPAKASRMVMKAAPDGGEAASILVVERMPIEMEVASFLTHPVSSAVPEEEELEIRKKQQKSHADRIVQCAPAATASPKKDIMPKRFPCDICDQTFCSEGILKRHRMMMHIVPTNCVNCGKMCNLPSNKKVCNSCRVAKKAYEASTSKRFLCDICEHTFLSEGILNRHHLMMHVLPTKCKACGKMCKLPRSRKICLSCRNAKTTSQGKKERYLCDTCGETFERVTILRAHLRIFHRNVKHLPRKKFVCVLCGKSSTNKETFLRHCQSHKEKLVNQCQVCGRRFRLLAHLLGHMKSHSVKHAVTYECKTCGRHLKTKNSLKQHKRMHMTERPYKCNKCEKAFKVKYNLIVHYRSHNDEKPFACGMCEKTYKTKSSLLVHFRLHTGEKPFKCSFCDKSYRLKQALVLHEKSHTGEKPFPCTECTQAFNTKEKLKRHGFRHGFGKYKCDICSKTYGYKSFLLMHMRVHRSERPFKCKLCDRGFISTGELNRHMKRAHGY